MIIGYARVSTMDQDAGFQSQIDELGEICDRVYSEKTSANGPRPKLELALEHCRQGDVLVVTKLDRLVRSIRHLCELIDIIDGKKAHLKILNLGLDTTTPTGTLILSVLGAVAEFERTNMKERQREGIEKARAEGKYKGRKPKFTQMRSTIRRLRNDGVSMTEIAHRLDISRSHVYKLIKQSNAGDLCGQGEDAPDSRCQDRLSS